MRLSDDFSGKSRLAVLLDHFATIPDPRDVRRIAHPPSENLLLVVCGTIADCDDYDRIAAWGERLPPIPRSIHCRPWTASFTVPPPRRNVATTRRLLNASGPPQSSGGQAPSPAAQMG